MPDNTLDQIVEQLRNTGCRYFPQRSEVRSARVVGHTPKADHYTYEIVLDFSDGSDRLNAKIYRRRAGARSPQELAIRESQNLHFAYQALERRKLNGIPRPVGDFADLGAVVSTKVSGLPLQSIIIKSALLPDTSNHGLLRVAAQRAGEWLQQFHKATSGMASSIDGNKMLTEMQGLCAKAQKDGLPAECATAIINCAANALERQKRPIRASAILQNFVPLNVLVAEDGVGFCEFANLSQQGHSLADVASFLAVVEALEKYPFCNHRVITLVQDAFVEAYGVSAQEEALLDALKMKVLLQMFAQGRVIKDGAERKKVMWANVMQRFIRQAAERSAARAA